jgi:predicted MFS family arabinose efflux permease
MRTNIFRPIFRSASFRRLWLGLVVSRLGDQFTSIALVWFVLQLTGSGAAIGLVILCFRLPPIIAGALAGSLLDHYQPSRVMALDNLARALIIAALPVLFWAGSLNMLIIYGLAIVAGTLSPITEVGTRMLLPYMVEDEELETANALASLSWQTAFLVGPALAGVLIARIGGPWVLLLDAASFFVIGVVLLSLPLIERLKGSEAEERESQRFGFGLLFKLPVVRAVTLLSLIFFFAYGPLETALPVYSLQVTGTGVTGYGLLWSAFGLGTMLGLLLINRVAGLARPGAALALIAVLWGLCLFPLTLSASLTVGIISLCAAGFIWSPYNVIETTLIQRIVPAHLRGRVFGARSTLLAAGAPLGASLGGLLLDRMSAPKVIGLSALACLLAGLSGLISPTLRNLSRKESV